MKINKKKLIKTIVAAVIAVLIVGTVYYFWLPPLNIFASEFWAFVTVSVLLIGVPIVVINSVESIWQYDKKLKVSKLSFKGRGTKILLGVIALPILVLVLGGIFSSAFFNARGYASIITVEERVFEDDMPVTTSITNIALMDSASASVLGNRTLGSLANVVSQYDLSNTYTQINYKGAPQKVSNLEYGDFFKWLNNKGKGIPGYVMVDPVNNDAEYKELEKPLKYVDSAYFGDDLMRKLRFSYPTKIFDSVYFEIDENGAPYFIVSCIKPKIGLFGAYDVNEVIVFDPCDGSSEIYGVAETPSWIDIVYTGDLACNKYNWYGLYSNGFFNSIIGNVDCKQTTDDYGYIMIGDDVWYFTGVTSVSSDESNIGFIITNARTGEYKFYPVVGAEEHSAMSAAQGEVQEKGYVASFPSLVNISGEATYIMVLKDDYGLVKLYALVNVENYGIVATATTQKEAIEAYSKLLRENGVDVTPEEPEGEKNTVSATVSLVRIVNDAYGEPIVYLNTDKGVFKKSLTLDESLMLIVAGDTLTIEYVETEVEGIYYISDWEKLES